MKRICAIAVAALLSGCNLTPHYNRPPPPIPSGWASESPAIAGDPSAADVGWRDFFSSPAVQRLIELALANNRDLRVTALNVQAAEAQYRVQRGGLFPSIGVTGLEQVERIPGGVAQSSLSGSTSGGGVSASAPGGIITRFFQAGVGFTSYELDVFGRVRSLDRAAFERYLSDDQSRRSAQISLIAEVVDAYLVVVADRAILTVTRDTLKAQSASNELIRHSLDAGTTTALALRQSDITVETARANLAAYTRQEAQDRDALLLLLGTDLPADFEFTDDPETAVRAIQLPAGIPSQVLIQRPDVLAAEHQLIANNADIGAARAAFFPSISLTANYGTASSRLSGLFKSGSEAWTFAPQITLPVFTGGANSANLDLARIEKNVAVAQYEKAVQSAFREVNDALIARSSLDEQLTAQQALVNASADALRLADMRFRNGIDSFLTVLDAQRSLYSAQQGLIGLKLSRLQNFATLYKALGGGLREHSER